MESRFRNTSGKVVARRDARRAAPPPLVEPRSRSARHRLLQSLDDLQRKFAITRVTCVRAFRCLAAQTFEVVADSTARARRDWRRFNAHGGARIVAFLFDLRCADRGAGSALANV